MFTCLIPYPTVYLQNRKLLTLKASNIVRQIVVLPHGKILVGSCDDGCYVWNIDNIDDHQTRYFDFIFSVFNIIDEIKNFEVIICENADL